MNNTVSALMTRMQGDDSVGLTNEHAHKTYRHAQLIAIGAAGIIRQLLQPYYTPPDQL